MTVKELKDWLVGIPEEHLDYTVCIRDVKKAEEEDKIGFRDMPIVYGTIDINRKQLALLDIPSHEIIKELQAAKRSESSSTATTDEKIEE